MRVRLAPLLVLSLLVPTILLHGQISLSTNAVSFTQRQIGPSDFAKEFHVNGTGNITVGSCVDLTPGISTDTVCDGRWLVTYHPSNAAPTTARVSMDGFYINAVIPPTTQARFTVVFSSNLGCTGNCVLTVTINFVPQVYPTFHSPSGAFVGCSNSDAMQFSGGNDKDTCVMQGGYTPGPTPFNMFVGPGNTYTDANFGGTVRQVTENPPSWHALAADSTNSSVNSDGTLVFVTEAYGSMHIYDTTTGARKYYVGNDFGADTKGWDPRNPKIFYYLQNLTIHKVVLGVSPVITSDTVILNYPAGTFGNTLLSNSNNAQVSKDGWWVFLPDKESVSVIVNLNTTPATYYKTPTWVTPYPGKTVCGTYSGGTGSSCDFGARLVTMPPGINLPDNKRYFITIFYDQVIGGGYAELYSLVVGGSTVVDEGDTGNGMDAGSLQPDGTEGMIAGQPCDIKLITQNRCMAVGHESFVEVNGVQYWVGDIVTGSSYTDQEAMIRLDKKRLMSMPVENGGGTTIIFGFAHGMDQHVNCATLQPVCVFAPDISYGVPAYNVQTASGTGVSPIHLTTDNTYPGANGDSILVGGMNCDDGLALHGSYAANGVQTVANLSGTALDLTGTTSTCNFVSGYGSFIANTLLPGDTYPHHNELMVIDVSKVATRQFTINRVAKARSEAIGDNLVGFYYGEPHPAISQDGSVIAFESNNGTPDTMAVFSMRTGFSGGTISGNTTLRGVTLRGVKVK